MHYKNGRVAQNGDKIVSLPVYGSPTIGVLFDATPGNDACNGKVAAIASPGVGANLAECLHLDDVKAALGELAEVPDTSQS